MTNSVSRSPDFLLLYGEFRYPVSEFVIADKLTSKPNLLHGLGEKDEVATKISLYIELN
jgi:hypothetical protein